MTNTIAERVHTLVIGAGQAGLSLGYHLRRLGRDCLIVEGNTRVGDNWRSHWDSLRLYSPARNDGLPGMDFPAPRWSYPSKDDVAEFLETYVATFEVATGTYGRTPYVPEFAAQLDPRIVQLHSAAYRNPAQLQLARCWSSAPRIPAAISPTSWRRTIR